MISALERAAAIFAAYFIGGGAFIFLVRLGNRKGPRR